MANFKKITVFFILLILLLITVYKSITPFLTTTSASKDIKKLSTQVFAMDTVMSITIYNSNEEILNLCKERILELENLFSESWFAHNGFRFPAEPREAKSPPCHWI